MLTRELVDGATRAVRRCRELGLPPYSDMASGLFRAYLTPGYRASQARVREWMREAGMHVSVDPAANLVGRYDGSDPDAPCLIIGSHLDSVPNAGCYDGPLGVMLGIEVVAALSAAGRRMPFHVEVYAFGDEEGSRFPAAMLTSRAVAGTLDEAQLDIADADGIRLCDAGVDVSRFSAAAKPHGSVIAYFEAHIEQGPVLEARGLSVGTVTGIAAQLRYSVTVSGQAGHAGTTAMALRRDALAGAADMILFAERFALLDQTDLVATIGKIEVTPGAPNVICGCVSFSLDVRCGDQQHRDRAAEAILREFRQIAAARNLGVMADLVHDLPASPSDPVLMDLLDDVQEAIGIRPLRLVSGAGHDAMVMAALAPTAMLFIRCRDGISHNPAEYVEIADVDVALRVMLGFVERLGAKRYHD